MTAAIPGAINFPFSNVYDGNHLKSKEELCELFDSSNIRLEVSTGRHTNWRVNGVRNLIILVLDGWTEADNLKQVTLGQTDGTLDQEYWLTDQREGHIS